MKDDRMTPEQHPEMIAISKTVLHRWAARLHKIASPTVALSDNMETMQREAIKTMIDQIIEARQAILNAIDRIDYGESAT